MRFFKFLVLFLLPTFSWATEELSLRFKWEEKEFRLKLDVETSGEKMTEFRESLQKSIGYFEGTPLIGGFVLRFTSNTLGPWKNFDEHGKMVGAPVIPF